MQHPGKNYGALRAAWLVPVVDESEATLEFGHNTFKAPLNKGPFHTSHVTVTQWFLSLKEGVVEKAATESDGKIVLTRGMSKEEALAAAAAKTATQAPQKVATPQDAKLTSALLKRKWIEDDAPPPSEPEAPQPQKETNSGDRVFIYMRAPLPWLVNALNGCS